MHGRFFLKIFLKSSCYWSVVSVNTVKISTIFFKLMSLYFPFLLVFFKDLSVFLLSHIVTQTAQSRSQSFCEYSYPLIPPPTTVLEVDVYLASGRYRLQVCMLNRLCRYLFPLNICVLGIVKFSYSTSS